MRSAPKASSSARHGRWIASPSASAVARRKDTAGAGVRRGLAIVPPVAVTDPVALHAAPAGRLARASRRASPGSAKFRHCERSEAIQ